MRSRDRSRPCRWPCRHWDNFVAELTTTVPAAVPPETCWAAGDTTVSLATPPENTSSAPPITTVPLAVPWTSSAPLPDTTVLIAVPPLDTTSSPPLDTTVPLAVPPLDSDLESPSPWVAVPPEILDAPGQRDDPRTGLARLTVSV